MVRLFLVVQMSDACYKGAVAAAFRPGNGLMLCPEGIKDMVRMIFYDIVIYVRTVRTAFRTRFHVNVRHVYLLTRAYTLTG